MEKNGNVVLHVRKSLQEVGYSLVQSDVKIDGASSRRIDVLAYATNADGDLVPWVAVEVKAVDKAKPEMLLSQLLKAREILGTVEHYAVINGRWFRADRTLRAMTAVDGPEASTNQGSGLLTDPALATSLLTERLWFEANKARRHGLVDDVFFPSVDVVTETALPGIETVSGDFVPVRPDVLWQARRRALASFTAHGRNAGKHATAPVLADAIARLVGSKLHGTVLDPFCGTGNFLWAAMDRAATRDVPVEFVGQEINVELADLAGQIARDAPMLATVAAGDSFHSNLPEADVIVTAPPFQGMQNIGPLLNGGRVRGLEVAALDLCLRQLRPGGRAVVLLPTSITFRANLESYRQFLANEFCVGALIGLPAGAVEGTTLRAVLLVVDHDAPGETFVAQLGEDWQAQLSETGAALKAALEHLDGG